ncbi:MAG: serine/threonine protein kinase [Kiritimatiellia bacterium]|jgi:serine/threonine protein kinase
MLEPGSQIGRYRLDKHIGLGGMAATFLCTLGGVGGFQKHVILKIMRPEHRDDEHCRSMFLDEARISARLQHSNIAQVFELGDYQGLPYLVMEYVRGPSLLRLNRRLYNEGAPPSGRHYGPMIRVFMDVLEALEYAGYGTDVSGEELDVVHRDVSLGNILVGINGVARLIDFGIAKTSNRLTETQQGMLKGKMQYMAPESVSGGALDPRADLFSLGVCLYISASGHYPYSGENMVEVWKSRTDGDPVAASTLCHDFPPGLNKIIQKAMQQLPEDRYQRPSHMRADLERLAETLPDLDIRRENVAEWLDGLFPDGDTAWIHAAPRKDASKHDWPQPVDTNIDSLAGFTETPPGQPTTIRRFPLWRGVALGALAVSVLVFSLLVALGPFRTGANPDSAAGAYVQEGRRLIEQRQYTRALEMLQKANELDPQKPTIVIELAQLTDTTRRAVSEARAKRHIEAGDLKAAREIVRNLYDHDPLDPGATALLSTIQKATANHIQSVATGTLQLSTVPPGVVFIDDTSYGLTPVRLSLAAGEHRIDVRLAGHKTYSKIIMVAPDEALTFAQRLTTADNQEVGDKLAALSAEVTNDPPDPIVEQVEAVEDTDDNAVAEMIVEPATGPTTEPVAMAPGRILILSDGRSQWGRDVTDGVREALLGVPTIVEARVPSGLKPSVVVTVGTVGEREAMKALPGVPTIAIGVRSLNGLSVVAAPDPEELAQRIRLVLPKARRVTAVTSGKTGFWRAMQVALADRGAHLQLHVVNNPDQTSMAIDEALMSSDLLVMMPDPSWNRASVSNALKRAHTLRVPVLSFSLNHFAGQAPASMVFAPEPTELGRQAGAEAKQWRSTSPEQQRRGTLQATMHLYAHRGALGSIGVQVNKRNLSLIDHWR